MSSELTGRAEQFAHRIVDVAESLESQRRSRRVVDQLIGCGTSVGANVAEADEALSRADFCRILGFVSRELSECRFWLRFVAQRGWIATERLLPLEREADELRRIFGSMVARTRRHDANDDE